jgi:ribosomal-protein-alanine N-acetyltransferase
MVAMSIQIREHVIGDLAAYLEWQTDPRMVRYVSWLPRNKKSCEASLHDAIEQQKAEPRIRYFFAVVDSFSNEVIGDVGFTILENNVADCGWFIRRKFWRRGYGSQAVLLMINFVFEKTEVQELIASCVSGNHGSESIMKNCGFELSRTDDLRKHYTLRREQWKKSNTGLTSIVSLILQTPASECR